MAPVRAYKSTLDGLIANAQDAAARGEFILLGLDLNGYARNKKTKDFLGSFLYVGPRGEFFYHHEGEDTTDVVYDDFAVNVYNTCIREHNWMEVDCEPFSTKSALERQLSSREGFLEIFVPEYKKLSIVASLEEKYLRQLQKQELKPAS